MTSISLTRMTMFNVYMRPGSTKQRDSRVMPDPKPLKWEPDVIMSPSVQMPVENRGYFPHDFEADVMMVDEPPPPTFPVVPWFTLLLSSSSSFTDLLEFHQYLVQAVASLLRKPLFEHISRFKALDSLSDVYQMCTNALERRQLCTIDRNSHNAAQWTASDCLVIIDECWNDGCCDLFPQHPVPEDESPSRLSASISRPTPKMISSPSQWAPVSVHQKSTVPSAQLPEPHSPRFTFPIRKVVQVLGTQLIPFRRDQLPRDNPLSWSQLLWEGLIEDIRRVLIAGKFFDSIVSDSIGSPPRTYLQNVIQSWISEARRLCHCRSNGRMC
ncbi:hypothetical protein DFH28DRAFT_292633 [Melampsora americana]|nr:hypothetical protein DFH28DRAFT_292633 [Melampsora americana]